jgi:multiple sugar transport system permease protein
VALILAVTALTMLVPFVWMVSTSLKPNSQVFAYPPIIIPHPLMFSNYAKALVTSANFALYCANSLLYALTHTLGQLVFSTLAGYAFARLRFRFKELLFWFLLATMMVPQPVTMVPLFLMLKHAPLVGGNDILGNGGSGWINTWYGLVLPGLFGGGYNIFLVRQFLRTLPRELDDAARIDGCGEFHLFARIILPLCKPVLAVLALFTFQGAWNDFLWPLIVTTGDTLRTIQLGLVLFQADHTTQWTLLMAASTVAVLPVVILFLCTQRYFVQGIALTGMKG